MVKHFTNDEADAGSTPADISYVTLNYFILTIYEHMILMIETIFLHQKSVCLSLFLTVYPYVTLLIKF
jgi:hypothetical protein